MALQEHQDISGRLTLLVTAADGRVVEERAARNTITTGGRQLLARLFNPKMPENIPRVSRIGLGGDGTPTRPGDTALRKPVGFVDIRDLQEDEVMVDGKPRTVLRIVGELGEDDCNEQLQEAGLFTGADEGTPAGPAAGAEESRQAAPVMYNRVTFAPISKSPEFKLTLVWEITF